MYTACISAYFNAIQNMWVHICRVDITSVMVYKLLQHAWLFFEKLFCVSYLIVQLELNS